MTTDRKTILAGQVELDLRGFQRRVPRRAIAALLGSTDMGASLSLTFNAVMNNAGGASALVVDKELARIEPHLYAFFRKFGKDNNIQLSE